MLEYMFLNMDNSKFYDSQEELEKYLARPALLRAIPNWKYNQILIAGGEEYFSEFSVTFRCRRLTGVLKWTGQK